MKKTMGSPGGRKREDENIQASRPTKNRRLEHLWKPMDLMSIEARIEFAIEAERLGDRKVGGHPKRMSPETRE